MRIIKLYIEDGTASSTAYYEPLLFEELERVLRREGLRLVRLEPIDDEQTNPDYNK